MYATGNPRTKKQLRERIEAGETVRIFQPGGLFNQDADSFTGFCSIEGPHYPEPHRWYARARVENGRIVHIR